MLQVFFGLKQYVKKTVKLRNSYFTINIAHKEYMNYLKQANCNHTDIANLN